MLSDKEFNLTGFYYRKALDDSTTGLEGILPVKSSRGIQPRLQVHLYEKPVTSTASIQKTCTTNLPIPIAFNFERRSFGHCERC